MIQLKAGQDMASWREEKEEGVLKLILRNPIPRLLESRAWLCPEEGMQLLLERNLQTTTSEMPEESISKTLEDLLKPACHL